MMRLLNQKRLAVLVQRRRHRCAAGNHRRRQKSTSTSSPLYDKEEVISSSSSTTTTIKKPFSEIPGDWRSMFPVVGVLPVFLPYFDRTSGGMRVEDFLYDYYEKYGKETGIAQLGPRGRKTVLVFDEGYLEVFRNETKSYPSGILEPNWPIQQYNHKYLNGLRNPFLQKGEEWRRGRMAINPYLFNIQTAQSYVPAINESVRNAVENYFEKYVTTTTTTSPSSSGRCFNFDTWCELTAIDMFTAAALGIQTNSVGHDDPIGYALAKDIIGGLGNASYLVLQCPYSKQDIFQIPCMGSFRQ